MKTPAKKAKTAAVAKPVVNTSAGPKVVATKPVVNQPAAAKPKGTKPKGTKPTSTGSGTPTSTTRTTTKGNTSTSTTTTNEQPGKAWVLNSKGKWVKPKQPAGEVAWNDNSGWVEKSTAAQDYAMPLAIIKSDPDLERLFNEAWESQKNGQEWSKEKFQVRLQATNWFKTKSESERFYYTLQNDPAEKAQFENKVNAKIQDVISLAKAGGMNLSIEDATRLGNDALRLGQTPAQLTSIMADYVNYSVEDISRAAGSLFGAAGQAEDGIRDWAKRNGVSVSDSYVLGQVRAAGKSLNADWDISQTKDSITSMAKQQYSHWAGMLDGGTTLDDLASGFKNIYSTEMDEDFANLGMDNRWIQEAMSSKDTSNIPITQDAFRKTLYKSNEWANVTKNKDKITGIASDVLTKFGMR